jgi:site-specific DNA-methyltransferase (adenine-specific)/site-specific DNA-methyltransferase (cytosine-N4-specific)
MTEEITIRVEYTDFEEVESWPRNPKDHDLHEIRKSFYRFGFIKPILVDEGTKKLVAGHGRLRTLRLLKNRGTKPPRGVVVVEDRWLIPVLRGVEFSDPAEAEAFLLADNRLGEIGGWKQDLLDTMLEEMVDVEGLLEGTGFNIADALTKSERLELKDMMENTGDKKLPDQCQEKWEVERGQIWRMNKHRIMCGDSANIEEVNLLLEDSKVTGIVTSPPYAERRSKTYGGIPTDEYIEWFNEVQKILKSVLLPTGHFLLNIKSHTPESGKYINQRHLYVYELVVAMVKQWGWCFIDEYCWPHMVPPRRVVKKFRNSWEPIYWFTKQTDFIWFPEAVKGKSDTAVYKREESWGNWSRLQGRKRIFVPRGETGDTYPSNVLYFGRVVDSRHPAQFPEQLPSFFMQACSLEEDKWYDPFCGSGTTLFAADEVNRIGYGMELMPEYVALVLEIGEERGLKIKREV